MGERGGVNLYVYCANDPVNAYDPLGLSQWFVGGCPQCGHGTGPADPHGGNCVFNSTGGGSHGTALAAGAMDEICPGTALWDNPIFQYMLCTGRLGFKNAMGTLFANVSNLFRSRAQSEKQAPGSGEGSGCFVAGTIVKTESGDKPIEEVEEGECVWTYDTETRQWQLCEVAQTMRHEYAGDVITIAVAGEEIEASGNHPLWVVSGDELDRRPAPKDVYEHEKLLTPNGRWVEARDLRAGDALLLISGPAVVESVAQDLRAAEVFNFHVDGLHTYAVSRVGAMVHNKPMRRKPGKFGQFKGRDALRAENRMARDAAKAAKLTKDQQRILHDTISGQGLSYQKILEAAKEIEKGNF